MTTRSYIAIEDKNGTVKGVWCHCDGYLEHNGKILLEHYNTLERAKKIVNLGYLDYLGVSLEPSELVKNYDYIELRYLRPRKYKAFNKLPSKIQLILASEDDYHTTALYRDYAKYLTAEQRKRRFISDMSKPKIDKFNNLDDFWKAAQTIDAEYFYYFTGKTWKVNFCISYKKDYNGSLKYALKHYTKKD